MLDSVTERTQQLVGTLGSPDRRKVDEYLTAIRDIEKRIARVENEGRQLTPEMEKPAGAPAGFVDHATLMNDLLAAAFPTANRPTNTSSVRPTPCVV